MQKLDIEAKRIVNNHFMLVTIKRCKWCGSKDKFGSKLYPTICIDCLIKKLDFERAIERGQGTNLYALLANKKVFGNIDQKWNETYSLEFKNSLLNAVLTEITGNFDGHISEWKNFYRCDKPLYVSVLRDKMSKYIDESVMDAFEQQVMYIVHTLMTNVCICSNGREDNNQFWKYCNCGNMIDLEFDTSVDDLLIEVEQIKRLKELLPGIVTIYDPTIKVYNSTCDHTCYAIMVYHCEKFKALEFDFVNEGFIREPEQGTFDRIRCNWIVFNKDDITIQLGLYFS